MHETINTVLLFYIYTTFVF